MMNLYEILKGHENETFYCLICGDCKVFINKNAENGTPITVSTDTFTISLDKFGRLFNNGECLLFPSKNQRNWNKWRSKVPKTWKELCDNGKGIGMYASIGNGEKCIYVDNFYAETNNGTPIEKSALALLKIHQLIEVGYGGNITDEEWDDNDIEKHCIIYDKKFIHTDSKTVGKQLIAFHTIEQLYEFTFYEENKQLLKDFWMI